MVDSLPIAAGDEKGEREWKEQENDNSESHSSVSSITLAALMMPLLLRL